MEKFINNPELKKYEYYRTENGVLYCGDCLEIMKLMPDKSVDLVLTDPPYGVRKKEVWDKREYFLKNLDNWLSECLRLSKTIIWFTAGSVLPYVLRNREEVFHRLLIWNKPPGSQLAGAMHSNIWYSMEPILVFGEAPTTNKQKKYGFAVFDYPTVPSALYNHPTTKPLGLIEELLYFYSQENNLVLDPFLGSGTTAVACERLGRKWIGIEIKLV